MSNVAVRLANSDDAAALAEVYLAAARDGWKDMYPRDALRDDLPSPEGFLIREIERRRPVHAVLVAEYGGALVGFAVVRPSEDRDASSTTGELHMLYTHPRIWGKGVGRALLTDALAWLRASGFREVTLTTDERNYRARRIYETAGWILDGTVQQRIFLGFGFSELRYSIKL